MLKKIGIGLLVTLLLSVGIVGVAMADDPEPTTEGCGPWCTRFSGLAEALGMDSEEVAAALSSGKSIAELAEEQEIELGDLIDALVNPRIAEMKERMREQFQSGDSMPFRGDKFSFGMPFGGRMDRMERAPRVDPLSDALGLTMDEVMEALQDGKTIAELAEEQGITLDELADAIADEMAEHMSLMVESGHLTQEELEARIEQMRATILESLESGTGRFGMFLGHREGCEGDMLGHGSFRMPHGGMQGFQGSMPGSRGGMPGFQGGMRRYQPDQDADAEPSGFRGRFPATSSL